MIIIIISFIASMLLLWFSFIIFLIGKSLYGIDAILLWAGGLMFIMAIHTLADIFHSLINRDWDVE